MNYLPGFYFGMVTNVYSPKDKENASKYQHEYQVLVTGEDYSSIPCRCIRIDAAGSGDDFDDTILQVAAKVLVQFPRGDASLGIIIGSTRAYDS